MRVALWNGPFSRKYPGHLLRDISRETEDITAAVELIRAVAPDVLVLTRIDYDADLLAARGLADLIGGLGHVISAPPNSGVQTGLDIDGDGRTGGPGDAQGYGWFAGQAGMAVLARWPVALVADHTPAFWATQPGALIGGDDPAFDTQRLHSVGGWDMRVEADPPFDLWAFHATPPVFSDRHDLRNQDELRFWTRMLDDRPGGAAPLVVAAHANTDPEQGGGTHEAAGALVEHPSLWSASHPETARFEGQPPLRLSFLLPDRGWQVIERGAVTPPPEISAHSLIWVDLEQLEGG